MKLKRFAVGFIAAVMAFAVLGTPLGGYFAVCKGERGDNGRSGELWGLYL